MNKKSPIFIAGPKGLVGSAIIRCLEPKGYTNFLAPDHSELELIDQQAVSSYFEKHKPEYVFLAAAKVGRKIKGIERVLFFYNGEHGLPV